MVETKQIGYWVAIVVMIICVTGITWTLYEVVKQSSRQAEYCISCVNQIEGSDRFRMYDTKYDPNIKSSIRTNGYFLDNSYYCVWTKGRETSDILKDDMSLPSVNQTALHELFHALIQNSQCNPKETCLEHFFGINKSDMCESDLE